MNRIAPTRRLWSFLVLVFVAAVMLTFELQRSAASDESVSVPSTTVAQPSTHTTGVSPTSTRNPFDSPLPVPTPVIVVTPVPGERMASVKHTYLPMLQRTMGYRWKGTAGGDVASPDWYYYWFAADPMPGGAGVTAAPDQLALLESGLQASAKYVPMVWCTSDVRRVGLGNPFPTPDEIAELARRYPGRVWLMFNEPDGRDPNAGCGGHIQADDRYKVWYDSNDFASIGKYVAEQYILYYDAIKAKDPSARIFSMAPYRLPLPTLTNVQAPGGVTLWNAFLAELKRQGRSIDGLTIHAYPRTRVTAHTPSCNDDMQTVCVQEALVDAYKFFQGTDATLSANLYSDLTKAKTIWLTETGVLMLSGMPVGGQPLSLERVSREYITPMVQWFRTHITPQGDAAYLNAVAWFVTFVAETPYTNLLTGPGSNTLTIVGETWRDAECPQCECPGPDCGMEGW